MAATQGPQSAPDTRLVRPRLSDDQLATLQQYGSVEPTTVGQVLFAAGDPSYDLIVLLEGTVEVSVVHDGKPWHMAAAGPRDFLAELNLLTGQRVYFTGVVTEACGCRKPMPPGDIHGSRPRRGHAAEPGNGPGR